MCTVVNKYKSPFDVYIGRGSVWGNPYPMQSEADRANVIELYRKHLHKQIHEGTVTIPMLLELDGKRLGCFCKPKPCHGDVIVRAVAWAKEQTCSN